MISAGITPALASLHQAPVLTLDGGPTPLMVRSRPGARVPPGPTLKTPEAPPSLSCSQLGWPTAVPSGLTPASAQAASVSAQAAPNAAAAQTHVPQGLGVQPALSHPPPGIHTHLDRCSRGRDHGLRLGFSLWLP